MQFPCKTVKRGVSILSRNSTGVQSWESTAAAGNAVINVMLSGIYDNKKIAVIRFSMSVVFIFTTYMISNYF